MNLRKLGLAAALALATVDAGAIRAQQSAAPLIPEFPPDQEVCYGRTYDKSHLATHPDQRVESFHVLRSLTDDTMSETPPRTKEAAAKQSVEWERTTRAENSKLEGTKAGRTSLDVLVRFRKRPAVFSQTVECRKLEGNGFTCGVDCDGGGFGVDTDGKSLLIKLSTTGLRLQSGCSTGDESAPEVRLDPGKDDKSFRLAQLPMAACHAMRDAARPEWMRPGVEPLRKRLTSDTPLCFTAAGKLPAALSQRYRTISIEARGPIVPRAEDGTGPDFKLRVAATARSGRPFSKTLECRAEDYAFDCTDGDIGLRLTAAAGGGATIRERFYDGGYIAKLFGISADKLQPIALVSAACQSR